jgi:phage terminase large subunit-like protein
MTVINKMELGRELSRTISQINQQIDQVRKDAEDSGFSAYKLMDQKGNYVLIPLLAAKAQTLHALALVNRRD